MTFSRAARKDKASIKHSLMEWLESRRLMASIAGSTPAHGGQSFPVANNLTVTFNENMNSATLNANTLQLKDPNGATIPSAFSYNTTTRVATINPTNNLPLTNNYYSLKIIGGASGVKDSAGGNLAQDVTVSFTTGKPVFTETVLATGLLNPTSVQFADDGRIFIAEKRGIIKVFDNFEDTTPTIFADLRTQVHNFWDRGLLGMALDPKFTQGRPYIYVSYTYDADINGTAPKWGTVNGDGDSGGPAPTGTGATVSGRLSKLIADGNVMASEQVLINDWANQFPSHSIGDVVFGPDGYLYASGGDGASFTYADYGNNSGNVFGDPNQEGGALRVQDLLSPNDPVTLDGSVIRVDPDTGLGAPGNPLSGSADLNARRIIAEGLRNPFRLTFRPGTSELWIDDTGWNTWEEINRIVNATQVSQYVNFGWPAYEGAAVQTGYQSLNLPLLQQLYNNPSLVTTPYYAYNHGLKVVSGSTEPTGASSRTGLAFYTTGSFPKAYENALFFSDYSRKQIYVMYAGSNGLPDPKTVQLFSTGTTGSVYIKVGPDGNFYYLDYNVGTFVRVSANSSRAPIVQLSATPQSGPAPLNVTYSAAGSTDPDAGETLSFAWDLDGDGLFNDGNAPTTSRQYNTAGDRTATVKVTDSTGLFSTKSITVSVGNNAPVPVINTPATTVNWKVGDRIDFSGSATDVEDGTLAASKLSWNAVLVYTSVQNPGSTQDRPIEQFSGVNSGSFIAPEWDYPCWVEVRLTATDSNGVSTTTVRRIDPQIVTLNLASNPAGAPITLNSNTYTAPSSKIVIANSTNTIAAPASFISGGTTYNFAGWSDGGTLSHTFKASTATTTYTATYTAASSGLPNAPTNLTAFVLAGPQVSLAWQDKSNNETSFKIQRRYTGWIWEDLATVAANASGYIDTTAIGGVRYEYRVFAVNSAGGSAFSNGVIVDTSVVGAVPPAAPTSLAATAVNSTRIDLTWTDQATGESGYKIERALVGGAFTQIALAPANSSSYVDSTVTAGNVYQYRIRATTGPLDSAFSNVASATTPGGTGTVPTAPTLLAATVATPRVTLTWKDNASNESAYVIQRRYTAWIWETIATIGPNSQSYLDTTSIGGVGYEYRIFAQGSAGASAFSNSVIVNT